MESNTILIILGSAAIAGVLYYFMNRNSQRTPATVRVAGDSASNALQLQAYERLTLLTDRIAIPNLISRTPSEGLSARDMQFILTKTIREEFEYNISQQIYVSAEVWNAVKGLKEKNLLIINQVAATLPAGASALDLNRAILEFLVTDKQADLPELVSQALSFEAKKLL